MDTKLDTNITNRIISIIDTVQLLYGIKSVKSTQQTYSTALQFYRGRIVTGEKSEKTSPSNLQSNYVENLRWSPDGTWILSYFNDKQMRIFQPFGSTSNAQETQEIQPWTAIQERYFGESIYDFCWYPGQNAADAPTCCYLVCARDHPVQLYDVFSSDIGVSTPINSIQRQQSKSRCQYVTKDHVDQVVSPLSVTFSWDGTRVICGLENHLQIFDTMQPGSEPDILRTTPSRKSPDGIKGLFSCLDHHPNQSSIVAAGSFSGSLGVFDIRSLEPVQLMRADNTGVSQVFFGRGNSNYVDSDYLLFSASRRANEIFVWDRRYAVTPFTSLWRPGMTQQRHYFDLDASGRFLVTGTQTGHVLLYDLAMAIHQANESGKAYRTSHQMTLNQASSTAEMKNSSDTPSSLSSLSAVYDHASTIASSHVGSKKVAIPVSRFSPISSHIAIGTGERSYAFSNRSSDQETDSSDGENRHIPSRASEMAFTNQNCEIALLNICSNQNDVES